MNTVVLHGSLKTQFGGPYKLDVKTVREAFLALSTQLDEFEEVLRQGAFRIVRTRNKAKVEVDDTLLDLGMSETKVDIYPAMAGAKSGLGKIVLGIAIVGAAVVTAGAAAPAGASLFGAGGALASGVGFLGITYGGLAAFGAMIALGGISMMFAPSPKAAKASDSQTTSSFIISSPTNVQEQGGPVPVIYGFTMVGSIVGSVELTIDQMLKSGSSYDVDDAYTDYGFPSYPATSAQLS